MTKFTIFRQEVSPGQTATIHLVGGETIHGTVTEVSDRYIKIDNGATTSTVFDDLIAGWQIHSSVSVQPTDSVPLHARANESPEPQLSLRPNSPSQTESPHESTFHPTNVNVSSTPDDTTVPLGPTAPHTQDPPHPSGVSPNTTQAHTTLKRIRETFDQATDKANVQYPEPNLEFPKNEFPPAQQRNVRHDWDRIRNIYNYAIKVKEPTRIKTMLIRDLQPLTDQYPDSAELKLLRGTLQLKTGLVTEAKQSLIDAALIGQRPKYWLALAASAQDDASLECFALRKYFESILPTNSRIEWYRYLAIGYPIDSPNIVAIIQSWLTKHTEVSPVRQFLIESVLFLLVRTNSPLAHSIAIESLTVEPATLAVDWDRYLASDHSDVKSQRLHLFEDTFQSNEQSDQTDHEVDEEPARSAKPVPYGRITFFQNQRSGFIEHHDGETLYFKIDYVLDDDLRLALLEDRWQEQEEVEFRIIQSNGHKYKQAQGIVRFQNIDSLLRQAESCIDRGDHKRASESIKKILGYDPTCKSAINLRVRINRKLQEELLPKDPGPYRDAKKKQFIDHDLKAAEQLFRTAINTNDRATSAILDLASLLHQRGSSAKAINLLEQNKRRFRGLHSSKFDNFIANLYQSVDRHPEALDALKRLCDRTPSAQQVPILRRIALSHFRSSNYDQAEDTLKKILEIIPEDPTASHWLVRLTEHATGTVTIDPTEMIADIAEMAEGGVELSALASAAIENCRYHGVPPQKIKDGIVVAPNELQKLVTKLGEFAEKLGRERPRDRAEYYLSAAALLNRNPSSNTVGKSLDYLRRYFASMADTALHEKKSADVVRSYYIESLKLVPTTNSTTPVWRTLYRYLATFAPELESQISDIFKSHLKARQQNTRQAYRNVLRETLDLIAPNIGDSLLGALLTIGARSDFARSELAHAILKSRKLRECLEESLQSDGSPFTNVTDHAWQKLCGEQLRAHRSRTLVCQTLTKCRADDASIAHVGDQLLEELHGEAKDAPTGLDRERLAKLKEITDLALTYCRGSDYEVRETNYTLLTTHADSFRTEVIDEPTEYSYEGLLPIAEQMRSIVEEEYTELARTSLAELSLTLLIEEHHLDPNGGVRLQLRISNKAGCSPATHIRLLLGPEDSRYFSVQSAATEGISSLRGGSSNVVQITLYPTQDALRDLAFPITVTAYYRDRLGGEKRSTPHTWSLRLYRSGSFEEISNPYTRFANGGPVTEPDMFVGREDLLGQLESALIDAPNSKSIVIYGQKRAGKSSLLEHLRQRLVKGQAVIPVALSLQEIATELSVASLFYRIIEGIADELDNCRRNGRDVPRFSAPSINEFDSRPTTYFHRVIKALIGELERVDHGLRLVVLVDEFTDIYKAICEGHIPREFMKAWKSIIEKRYFSSVLVGQDIMPRFKESFPNEFGVTEDIRITYLDSAAASELVQGPIGEGRFVGNAVSQIFDLTARSPYYTMMFCDRLVDYMNVTRSERVTEADIRAVERLMLRGDRRLTRDKFDNLLAAGDGIVDSGIDPSQTYAVCQAIARISEREGFCARDRIQGFSPASLTQLLDDLESRDVVVSGSNGTTYRLQVGLFRDWLVSRGDSDGHG